MRNSINQSDVIQLIREMKVKTSMHVLGTDRRFGDEQLRIVTDQELQWILKLSNPEKSIIELVDKKVRIIRGLLKGLEGFVRRYRRGKRMVQLIRIRKLFIESVSDSQTFY